jgi:hypothetical protein
VVIVAHGKHDEDRDGHDGGQPHPDREPPPAPAAPLGKSGALGFVRARGSHRDLLWLEPRERFTTAGALADMSFDPSQLGQTDLALEQDTEALASVLARHGRDHG